MLNLDSERGAEIRLVTKIQGQENRECDVGSQEVGDGPVLGDKDLKAVCEGEEGHDTEDKVGEIWLERSAVGESFEEVVPDHGFAEADVGNHDDDPGDEAGDGGDV